MQARDELRDWDRLTDVSGSGGGAATVIETQRLMLRPLTLDDVEGLSEMYRDPDVRRYFPEGTLSLEETRDEVAWVIDVYYARFGFGLWATVLRDTGELIGRCGLLPWTAVPEPGGGLRIQHVAEHPPEPEGSRLEVELAYLLARPHWGRGLATEAANAIVAYAFERLRLKRLICLFDPENAASRRVAEKAGMTFERMVTIDGEASPLYARQAT
jgi:ribosomal-protein-alanine N-acetyltransferase